LHLFPVRDSVLDVKERIQATRSIPVARQRLLFEGRDLPDDLAIVDLPGESRDHGYSIIRLVVRAVEPIRIQIQARDGRSISLTVRTSDLVSEIKAQIQENEAIPIDEQHLFLGSDELGNQFILGDYPIREGRRIANDFTLHLRVPGDEARTPGPQSSGGSGIEIRINDLDDGTISSVRVRPTDRISVVAPLAEWDSSKVCKRAWLGGVMLDRK
jgi:hypothetical protein